MRKTKLKIVRATPQPPQDSQDSPEPSPQAYDRAKALGQRFFLGKPCRHGHGQIRYVANKACVECARASVRRAQARRKRQDALPKTPDELYLKLCELQARDTIKGMTEKQVLDACSTLLGVLVVKGRQNSKRLGGLVRFLDSVDNYNG